MTNRIRNVVVVNHRLDPHETELRIHVDVNELTPTTVVKGRLMGPRCVYRSTVEIAYPMVEIEREVQITLRVVIPEPSWWEPKTPFLYQGPLELWQGGEMCDRCEISHGIRTLGTGSDGWRLNGRSFQVRDKVVEQPFDESYLRQWHDEGINTLLTKVDKRQGDSDLWVLADRFGFFVMDEESRAILTPPETK